MIAHSQMLDRTADRGDDTRPLVTVDGGIRHREVAVAGMQIGLANAGRGDPDQHLVAARRVEFEAFEAEFASPLPSPPQ